MSEKALVLNSGGVDSTTCVGIAVDRFGAENVSTISVFYGQKHCKELKCAEKIAEHYGVPHYETPAPYCRTTPLDVKKIANYYTTIKNNQR